MKRNRKVLFCESIEGIYSFFTLGLAGGAQANGWDVSYVSLRDKNEKERPLHSLQEKILKEVPDLICFMMDAPVPWPQLWDHPNIRSIPKFSFWFDDFKRSPHTLAHPETWRAWQKDDAVTVCLWDGFWRDEWEKLTGYPAKSIHLAGDPCLSGGETQALFPELGEYAVLTGTIPSLASLEKDLSALPSVVEKTVRETLLLLEQASWPIRPYEQFNYVVENAQPKLKQATERWLNDPLHEASLNQQLWRWGKRIARIRGLRALAECMPVAVLSGHKTESFAKGEELFECIGRPNDFKFYETTEVSPNEWGGLFCSGKFQVQLTDPQSIRGGIPFRVFECMASGALLLSDEREELGELVADVSPEKPSVYLAKDTASLVERAFEIQKLSFQEIQVRTRTMRDFFLQRHTWEQRWKSLSF